jgi:hypothetical protein
MRLDHQCQIKQVLFIIAINWLTLFPFHKTTSRLNKINDRLKVEEQLETQ